jgi:transmembrane sensor
MKPTSMTYDQLYQYFSGHSSSFQKKQMEEWLKDDGNLERFYHALARWEKQNLQYTTDTSEALNRHRIRMEKTVRNETQQLPEQKKHFRAFRLRWLAAASLALVLLAVGGLYQAIWQYKTYATDYGQTLSFSLPDGSQVTLNANSSLRIPRFGFDEESRTVLLEGEAEFRVRHTRDHKRFIVKTPKALDVIVLGTEFTVLARERATRVALNSGKVELSYTNQNKTNKKLMKPGELATLDEEGRIGIQPIPDTEDPAAWKDHRFVFASTPLSEIALMLHEVFGVKVVIPEQNVARMTVSGSFTAHSAEELVQTLSEAATLTYQKEKRKIILQSR